MKSKKAGIYDPYLDTLGGGERYCLSVAEILSKHGYHVDIFWSGDKEILKKAQARFSLDLNKVNIVPDIFEIAPRSIDSIHDKNLLYDAIHNSHSPLKIRDKFKKITNKFFTTRKYDIFFFLSDGSNPFLFSKKNILHIQVPFIKNALETQPIIDPIKSLLFSNIICNSRFTSKFIQKFFHKKINVIYPPVDIAKFSHSQNQSNIILSVGRFDNILNSKKQDCLIDAFKRLIKNYHLSDWKLVLAGGSLQSIEQNSYLKLLKNKSKGLPVEFVVNPSFEELKSIYSKSKIYWHAAGYKVNENIHPEETEHFGMTIVEAMSSGLVPVVIKKGGIPEIIDNGINGFLWKTKLGLVKKTYKLIKDNNLLLNLQNNAIQKAKSFSKENFEQELLKLLKIK